MTNIKKIAFLHNYFPAGGADKVTINIANFARNHGYDTVVLAHESSFDFGITYPALIKLPDDGDLISDANIEFVIDYINGNGIDIFVVPGLAGRILGKIRPNISCKVVYALHSAPFWEATYRLYEKKVAARGHLLKRLKWHLVTCPRERLTHKYLKSTYRDYRKVYADCDAYVFLCDGYKRQFMRTLGIGDEEGKLHVIHNSERIPENVRLDKRKEIIFVGRLTYEDKRVDRLLQIWKIASPRLPEWQLRIVGAGPEQELLEAMATRLELERITFEGFHSNVKPFYDTASILCLTSTFEGWGLCLTEAQANGVVPVAFGCSDGVNEVISPSGTNGIAVPPFDIDAFASELVALATNEEKLRQMRHNVIEKSKTYSPEAAGEKWVELFNSLCKDKEL